MDTWQGDQIKRMQVCVRPVAVNYPHISAHSSGETRPSRHFCNPTSPLIKEGTKMV